MARFFSWTCHHTIVPKAFKPENKISGGGCLQGERGEGVAHQTFFDRDPFFNFFFKINNCPVSPETVGDTATVQSVRESFRRVSLIQELLFRDH